MLRERIARSTIEVDGSHLPIRLVCITDVPLQGAPDGDHLGMVEITIATDYRGLERRATVGVARHVLTNDSYVVAGLLDAMEAVLAGRMTSYDCRFLKPQ